MEPTEAPQDDERLARVQAEIDRAKQRVAEPEDDEPKFKDSGSIHPELDDPAIAPPG